MKARAGDDVFVGRARELEALEGVLDAARAGRGGTVLIAGEAGIGKTRLTSELSARARSAGFDVLLGRSIDLVGTELPYQPFAQALRPVGDLPRADGQQFRVFENILGLLTGRAASAPVLLVLEDLHWADTSTLDLVVYLAQYVDDRPLLLVATYRADEQSSAERMLRLANGVRRSGSALLVDLGPLDRDELAALVAAYAVPPRAAADADAIVVRSEGNPFFAQELIAAAGDGGLPRGLRELLLQRVGRLDQQARTVVRIASAAGREVGYSLLRAVAAMPEQDVRAALRQAVEHGVLVAEPATSSFRFRHALLAEAVYATLLPGEREEIHEHLAGELARNGATAPAELAPHWAAAGRPAEALAASVAAARDAVAVAGLAEARAHLERAISLWPAVANAAELTGSELGGICSWAAELASETGEAPRAVELARRAIHLTDVRDRRRAALLQVCLGEYLHEVGSDLAGLAALERAVELAPAEPLPDRAYVVASLAGGLMVAWRHAASVRLAEEALALARDAGAGAGAGKALVRALTVRGADLVYLGRAEEGLSDLGEALRLAEEIGEGIGLDQVYANLTDALTMLGRLRESVQVGRQGLEAIHRYGIASAVLVSNLIEALLAQGEWDEADELSTATLRSTMASFPYMLLMLRADLEVGRGDFVAAREHLDAALETLRPDRGLGIYDVGLAELALWERRWGDAADHTDAALESMGSVKAAQLRVWFCAKGLRAQAELAAVARTRRDADAERSVLDRADELIAAARRAAADAAPVTPVSSAWLGLAEAEYRRTRGVAGPGLWADAADRWAHLGRAPFTAYCQWRQAEALVAAGASRAEASTPARSAYEIAVRVGARPVRRELELLAGLARLRIAIPPAEAESAEGLDQVLGLTAREAEVLTLLSRGCTDREIAVTLVISIRTVGVHVSHILQKLGAANRIEAAAIAHRVSSGGLVVPEG
ncbi:helix-turn-helix transcriptional regulator [Kribbella sp. CA-245084]|uniref:helix-turn-helix transcriptional regulator n=1 Tax=Kribbella sp. CA-245084 TaxID=3239940 RepID=UPI003D8F59ED